MGQTQQDQVVWTSTLSQTQLYHISRGLEAYVGSNPARSRGLEAYFGSSLSRLKDLEVHILDQTLLYQGISRPILGQIKVGYS